MSRVSEVGSQHSSDGAYRISCFDSTEETPTDCSLWQAPVAGNEPRGHNQGQEPRKYPSITRSRCYSLPEEPDGALPRPRVQVRARPRQGSMETGRQAKPGRASHPKDKGGDCRAARGGKSNQDDAGEGDGASEPGCNVQGPEKD